MAKFPIVEARQELGFTPSTGVRADIDVRTGAEAVGAAIAEAGAKITEHFKKINENRQIAKGIAEYNNLINTHNENLAGKDPSEYNASFEALIPHIDAIAKSKTSTVRETLANRFTIWNETNRAETSLLAIRAETALAKQEMPDRLREFANNNQDAEAVKYIQGFSNILSPVERDVWGDVYGEIKDKNNIFRAINIAADNPTAKNISLAQKIIDKLSIDELDKFNNMNRLRAARGASTEIKNETFKAVVNDQSENMADSYIAGITHEPDVVPELNIIKTQFNARLANGTLSSSDGVTYNSISRQIDEGKFFDPTELTSSFATGMSKEEYQDIKKRNQDNARLAISQKESLVKFHSYIDDRYQQLINTVRPKTSPVTLPQVLAAVDADMTSIKKVLRRAIKDELPDNEIYDKIEASFVADTDRLYKGWWSRKFSKGFFTDIGDFEPEILEIGDRQERYEIITDIMKSGEKFDLKRLDDLLERWYE